MGKLAMYAAATVVALSLLIGVEQVTAVEHAPAGNVSAVTAAASTYRDATTGKRYYAKTSNPNHRLSLRSSNGKYRAIFQTDGNFVVYGPSGAIWQSHTSGRGHTLAMQSDGNVVIYTAKGSAVWNTRTVSRGYAWQQLAMQGDGNLVLYAVNHNGSKTPQWWSKR